MIDHAVYCQVNLYTQLLQIYMTLYKTVQWILTVLIRQ